jgi:hypothetical protein
MIDPIVTGNPLTVSEVVKALCHLPDYRCRRRPVSRTTRKRSPGMWTITAASETDTSQSGLRSTPSRGATWGCVRSQSTSATLSPSRASVIARLRGDDGLPVAPRGTHHEDRAQRPVDIEVGKARGEDSKCPAHRPRGRGGRTQPRGPEGPAATSTTSERNAGPCSTSRPSSSPRAAMQPPESFSAEA